MSSTFDITTFRISVLFRVYGLGFRELQKEHATLDLVVDSVGTEKLKLLVIYTSKQPRCFGRWQPHEYIWWHSNKTTWMKGEMFGACILQFNNQFKGQN